MAQTQQPRLMTPDDIQTATHQHDTARGNRQKQADLNQRKPLGIKLDGNQGTLTIDLPQIPDTTDAWNQILETNPYVTPETHEIDHLRGAEITSWDVSAVIDGQWVTHTNHRCKVPVKLKQPGERLTATKIGELTKRIRKRTPITPPETHGDTWRVVCLADFQLGKQDYGGTPATIERLKQAASTLRTTTKNEKPAGIALIDMGDIVEGIYGCYPNQPHTVDLNLTDQIDLATELILMFLEAVIDLTPRILVGFVPSNHGELRSGKAQTPTDKARDNIDLIIANSMTRIVAANPERYGHVEIWAPAADGADPYVLTLDLDGVLVGFAHGHQVTAQGKGRLSKLEQWWQNHQWTDRKRARGETLPTIADADIGVLGHGHTLLISEQTGKLLIQCPASENGSESFTTATGIRSSAGVLTFRTGERWPLLANHFEII